MRRFVKGRVCGALERARPMVEEFIAERLQLPLGFPHRLDSPAVQIREIRVLKVTALAKADYPPVQITVQIKATLAHRAVKLHGAWDFGAIDADVELTAHGIVAADGSHSIEPQAAALKAWWRDMTMVESKQIGRLGEDR